MASGNHRFGLQDILAVAVLAGTVTFLLQGKLETLAVRLNPAIRDAFSLGWPLLLIVAGMILLLAHHRSEQRSRRAQIAASSALGRTHES